MLRGYTMKVNKNGYYTNRHSCFLLQYHLVLVTKYRKPAIVDELENGLKEYTMQYFKDRNLPVHALETMPDHIHILFDAPPQINLSEFINAFKSASSRQMRKKVCTTASGLLLETLFLESVLFHRNRKQSY